MMRSAGNMEMDKSKIKSPMKIYIFVFSEQNFLAYELSDVSHN